MSAAFTTEERLTLFLERKIETSPLNYDEPLAFNVAENRLKQFALVGVTERFKESIQSLCSSMGWPVPDELPSENIDPMSAAMNMQLNADDEQLLTTLNQVDLKLYDLAQEMLGRLLAQA